MARTATTTEQRIFDLFAELETIIEMDDIIDKLEEFRRFVEKRDAKKNGPPKAKETGAPA